MPARLFRANGKGGRIADIRESPTMNVRQLPPFFGRICPKPEMDDGVREKSVLA
jgi:hypothetical protein